MDALLTWERSLSRRTLPRPRGKAPRDPGLLPSSPLCCVTVGKWLHPFELPFAKPRVQAEWSPRML